MLVILGVWLVMVGRSNGRVRRSMELCEENIKALNENTAALKAFIERLPPDAR